MVSVCFDFDGVLAEYYEWKDGEIGEPLPAGVQLANLLHEQGFRIVIQTCRTHIDHGSMNAQRQWWMVYDWLKKNDVPFDYIEIYGKPMADYYIDDRGVRFEQSQGNSLEYAEVLYGKIMQHRFGDVEVEW